MGEMQIDLGRTEQIADKMNSFEKNLRDYSDQIEQAAQKLRGNHGASIEALCDKIHLQNEEILREADKMESLSGALHTVLSEYKGTEEKITEYKNSGKKKPDIGDLSFIDLDELNKLIFSRLTHGLLQRGPIIKTPVIDSD